MAERQPITRCLAILGAGAVVAAMLLAGGLLAFTLFSSAADTSDQFPATGDAPLKIAAVGDGYVSGEGAKAFFPGTDRPGRNQCRRTSTSWPFLIIDELDLPAAHDGVELISVACSGARTTNLIPFDDLECRTEWFPDGCPNTQYEHTADGRRDPRYQVDRIPRDSDVVLVGIGAGDAYVNDVIALCTEAAEPCGTVLEPWLEALDTTVQWRLRRVYAAVKRRAPDARVAAVTYPTPLFRTACPSTRLDQSETDVIVNGLFPRLNQQIELAAAAESVHVIDLSGVLTGHRLCRPRGSDGERPEPAVNAFRVQPVRGITWKLSTWFHGSFYPNELGHRLMAERVATDLNGLVTATGLEGGRSTSAGDGATVPAFAAGPPGASVYDAGGACGARQVETRFVPRPIEPRLIIDDAMPASTLCFRPFRATWRSLQAPADDVTVVPLTAEDTDGFPGWHEVVYRSEDGWARLVVVAPAGSDAANLTLARAWLWPWLITVAEIASHPLIYSTLLVLAVGGWLVWCTRRRPEPEP